MTTTNQASRTCRHCIMQYLSQQTLGGETTHCSRVVFKHGGQYITTNRRNHNSYQEMQRMPTSLPTLCVIQTSNALSALEMLQKALPASRYIHAIQPQLKSFMYSNMNAETHGRAAQKKTNNINQKIKN